TAHPAMIAAFRDSPDWELRAVRKTGYNIQAGAKAGTLNDYIKSCSRGRAVVSFQYVGKRERAKPAGLKQDSPGQSERDAYVAERRPGLRKLDSTLPCKGITKPDHRCPLGAETSN